MKIDINKVKLIPDDFNFCVYGAPSDEILGWANHWKFEIAESGPYTNIYIHSNTQMREIFNEIKQYEIVDGFSPNLNKDLHVGHFSNLVIANAIQKLGIGKEFIAIFGDTLEGAVNPDVALGTYLMHCADFNYNLDYTYFASEMKLIDETLLTDGTGEYEGSKIFDLGDEKIVGIKSNGSTSYFYQDVALADSLRASTLYLTGVEQENHFKSLKKLFPETNHIGLGLVMIDGKKMSSSEGNVIYMADFIDDLMGQFNNDIRLVYNIMAGQILKSLPRTNKSINTKLIDNPKTSLGLYISYTLAHIKSCGVTAEPITEFVSKRLEYHEMKAKFHLAPNILFDELVNFCKNINGLYETHQIKGNDDNIKMFSVIISDLELGMKKLGLFPIDRV